MLIVYPSKNLIEKVKTFGIVGMGGAAFPTHVKLSIPEGKKIETLIINGAECEPFLTCDHTAMTKRTEGVLKGIELLVRVLKPKKVYIAIEDNKKASMFAFQKIKKKTTNRVVADIGLVEVKTKYPQGGEKQLIKAISGKEVPPGKLPLDIGFMVQNVGTCYALYEAIYFDKPLIERIVTISGDCMHHMGNYLMKVGTTIKDVMENYELEIFREPKKILIGGPMMGFAQPHSDVPVLKSTSGILFLSEDTAKIFEESNCIKCAKCVDVCPTRLVPTEIMKNVKNKDWREVENLYISDCMECGSCTYICPARIPLVQYIKEGKAQIAKTK